MTNRKRAVFGFDMESDVGSYTTTHKGVKEATPVIISIFKKQKLAEVMEFMRKKGLQP